MRKSEITTRMKKVFLKASALGAQAACTDEEIGELEKLISEATKEVYKLLQKQLKEHEKHLKALEKAPGYIDDIKGEIAARRSDARALLQEEAANLSDELLTTLKREATR